MGRCVQDAQLGPWYYGLCNDDLDVDFSSLHSNFSEVEMQNDELSLGLLALRVIGD